MASKALSKAFSVIRHAPKGSNGKLLDRTLAANASGMLRALRTKKSVGKYVNAINKTVSHASKK
jgi:hypothetical protein